MLATLENLGEITAQFVEKQDQVLTIIESSNTKLDNAETALKNSDLLNMAFGALGILGVVIALVILISVVYLIGKVCDCSCELWRPISQLILLLVQFLIDALRFIGLKLSQAIEFLCVRLSCCCRSSAEPSAPPKESSSSESALEMDTYY
jgi:hypothetical protein